VPAKTQRSKPANRKDMTSSEIQKVFDTLGLVGNPQPTPPTVPPPSKGMLLTYFPVSGSTSPQRSEE
jgi:hypothetical protein